MSNGDKRKTIALSEPERRNWKKKYDTLKKESRAVSTTISGEWSKWIILFFWWHVGPIDGISNTAAPTLRKDHSFTDASLDARTRSIYEIIETEQDYVKDLETIVHVCTISIKLRIDWFQIYRFFLSLWRRKEQCQRKTCKHFSPVSSFHFHYWFLFLCITKRYRVYAGCESAAITRL